MASSRGPGGRMKVTDLAGIGINMRDTGPFTANDGDFVQEDCGITGGTFAVEGRYSTSEPRFGFGSGLVVNSALVFETFILSATPIDLLNTTDPKDGMDGLVWLIDGIATRFSPSPSGDGDFSLFDLSGNETLEGASFADTLFGWDGDDLLIGGGGNDDLSGDAGADVIRGGAGDDTISGGPGADVLRGQAGNDHILGGGGADRLIGGGGNDSLEGGAGADTIKGNAGADHLLGNGGRDVLRGGGGNDTLEGGRGADLLIGGPGADLIIGGKGRDTMVGGGGRDVFVFNAGDGQDTINRFQQGADRLEFASGAEAFEDLAIVQQGADVLVSYLRGSILLTNQVAEDFDAADFIFA